MNIQIQILTLPRQGQYVQFETIEMHSIHI